MTTLYLKYRPQKISELDLTDVRELLSKIVSSGDIPHAFLFEGPRGSGKTSAARIIAKVLNCTNLSKDYEPCNKCEQCVSITKGSNIDVVELDAASHRGIDDIRLIRESVKLAPAQAKKKVYIIDEAHMLTTEASNALLKTLEEPPDHVVFILATTNPEKLLDTIKSRTVRVNFKKATPTEIVKSLSHVLEKEKKKFNQEVLDLIAKNVDGSFRDAKKILEELLIKGSLEDLNTAQDYILNTGDFKVEDFFTGIKNKDLKNGISILNNAEKAGVPSKTIYNQIINKLKSCLFSVMDYKKDAANLFDKEEIMSLADIFIVFWNKYQNDVSDYMPFYLAVSEWCGNSGNGVSEKPSKEDVSEEDKKLSGKKVSLSKNDSPEPESDGVPMQSNGVKERPKVSENISEDLWRQVLHIVRSKNASTEALLRASKPMGFDGQILSLGVFYKFHKEKLESIPHKICFEDCLRGVLGTDIKVECFLTQPETVVKPETTVEIQGSTMTNGYSRVVGNGGVVLSEAEDADLIKLAEEVFGS